MSWILEHTEVITVAALVVVPLLMIGGMMLIAGGKAPEVSDLQGAPETLGDFPPLEKGWIELTNDVYPDLSLEELEKILKGNE